MVALFYETVVGFVNFCCSSFGVFEIMILATMQAASITANQWRYLPNGAIAFVKAAVRLIKKRYVLLMVVHSETYACFRKRFARRIPTTPTINLEVVQVYIISYHIISYHIISYSFIYPRIFRVAWCS